MCVSALTPLSGHQCPSGAGPFLGSVPSAALYVLVSVYTRSERAVPGAPISFLTPPPQLPLVAALFFIFRRDSCLDLCPPWRALWPTPLP